MDHLDYYHFIFAMNFKAILTIMTWS